MRRRSRVSNVGAGMIAAVIIAGACYLVFGGPLPFSGTPFILKATFTTATELHIPSPVRIAGVDVGEVTSVAGVRGSSGAAVVTMEIQPQGLPIHNDATLKVRPRIFLEGNFYVDLHPGSPNARAMSSGSTLPAGNTAGPVQLDRVLASLNSDSRANLQTLLRGLGSTLDGRPSPSADASQDPSVRGLTGGQALNQSLKYSVDAFRSSAIVNQALLGSSPHDLAKVVSGTEQVFHALAAAGSALPGFVSTFNATMATLASRGQQLSQTIAVLPRLLRRTETSDSSLDASFAPTKAFARQILPGTKQLDVTIGAALPWLAQASALSSPTELRGLLRDLTPAVQNTASTLSATQTLLTSTEALARCFIHNVIPTGNAAIKDPPVGTGLAVYQELFQSAVGLAAAAQNFDGNGRYIRSSAGGGAIVGQTPSLPNNGPLFGHFVLPPLGTRPAFAGSPPPLRRDVACFRNPAPNLNSARTGTAP